MLQRTRSRPHPLGHRSALLAATSLVIVLAACGSSSKSSSTTAASATTAAAATTAAPATTAAAAATGAPTTAASATAATTTAASGSGSTAAAASGTPVAVTEKEFSIALVPASFTAGTYTFNVSNTGQFKHNLIIEGNGDKVQSDTFDGCKSGSVTATLKSGTYEIYCGIPTHKGKGMDLTVTVP